MNMIGLLKEAALEKTVATLKLEEFRRNLALAQAELHRQIEVYLPMLLDLDLIGDYGKTCRLGEPMANEKPITAEGVSLLLTTSQYPAQRLELKAVGIERSFTYVIDHGIQYNAKGPTASFSSTSVADIIARIPEYCSDFARSILAHATLESVERALAQLEGAPRPKPGIIPPSQLKAGWPGGYPAYPPSEWQSAVAGEQTRLGYWEWVHEKLTEELNASVV